MSATSEKWLSKMLEENLEKILRKLFFWENDEKRIGVCIRFIHHFIIYSCFVSYILLHIFMPSYFLFAILYFIVICIWLQHCIYGGCIFSTIESKLIGDTYSMWDPILDIFHITITPESTGGLFLLVSTTAVFVLTCEFVGKTVYFISLLISSQIVDA
jgi:hypothetical protein